MSSPQQSLKAPARLQQEMDRARRPKMLTGGAAAITRKWNWIQDRAHHYGEILQVDPQTVLDKWEEQRSYWFVNYYQDANQPKLDPRPDLRIYKTIEEAKLDFKRGPGFRCPGCGGISTDPAVCNSGKRLPEELGDQTAGQVCNWKAFGLLRCLGKGVHIAIQADLVVLEIFKPISWEQDEKAKADE